jgi:SAM-dependent methyltransferase
MSTFVYAVRGRCVCGGDLSGVADTEGRNFAWGRVEFRRCPACASWCQSPQITPGSIAAWYDSDLYQGSSRQAGAFYANYLADEPNRLRESRGRVRRDLQPLLPPQGGEIMEIGCASGSLLVALREAGHHVRGIDLSDRFVDAARSRHGLDVTKIDLASLTLPPTSLDLVLLLGTLSNLPEMPTHLSRILGWLRPGGHLVANFPAADSLTAKLYGRRYWMFAPTANTFYSTTGCRLALERAGFRVSYFQRDVQQPSWQKIGTHSRLPGALAALKALRLDEKIVPAAMPVPGVRLVVAQRPATLPVVSR